MRRWRKGPRCYKMLLGGRREIRKEDTRDCDVAEKDLKGRGILRGRTNFLGEGFPVTGGRGETRGKKEFVGVVFIERGFFMF